jgi:hypothetical protein
VGGKAVADNVGLLSSHARLWKNHPEKALVVNGKFAEERRDDLKKVMMAVLEASKYIDDKKNNLKVAEMIGTKAYTGAEPKVIADRLRGVYNLGGGNGTKDYTVARIHVVPQRGPNQRAAHRSRFVVFDAICAIRKIARDARRRRKRWSTTFAQDLYQEVASEMKIAVPRRRHETVFHRRRQKRLVRPGQTDGRAQNLHRAIERSSTFAGVIPFVEEEFKAFNPSLNLPIMERDGLRVFLQLPVSRKSLSIYGEG